MAIESSKLASSVSAPNGPDPLELVFLGTGTSSSLPHIECLTASPDDKPCRTCLSTLTPEGKKNIRRNTSAAFRMTAKDGRKVTVVIDAGKNFQAAALEWFPKYGLRRIDALLITHPHADAMNGLDDLRGWTLNNAIQSHIDVYVSQDTFVEVQRSFPYLVAKEFASGGGDVPEFKWHIINDGVPFEIQDTGIQVTPFSVHHGRIFSVAPPPAYMPTPSGTTPSTPTKTPVPLPVKHILPNGSHVLGEEVIHPYLCYGFKIGHEVVYISDVSHIPSDKWAVIQSKRPGDDSPLPVLVLDCLRLRPHTSHYGFANALETARRIGASRTYLVGFGHEVTHEEYIRLGEAAGGKSLDLETLTETEKRGLELSGKGEDVWVRPAHDGLRVYVEADGRVYDESY
ncbi:beta-lactamase-like protein [Lyophyllum atratum]|nr:beta-lactamase-like protein [Lyophyllum atratum]